MNNEVRMLSASGLLGYGFPEDSLKRGLTRKLHMVGVDGGSSDPRPHYLGSGKCVNSRMSMKRDMALLLKGAMSHKIPMMIGTCGGAGGEPHLQACVEILHEIAREEGFHFMLTVIRSDVDKAWLKERASTGKTHPLGSAGQLTAETIDRTEHIVGMMGPEPYLKALDDGAQVILAGRSTDPAPWAALAMHHGIPPAPAWYAGKMLECGTGAAIPKGHDFQLAAVGRDYVEVEPASPSAAARRFPSRSRPCTRIRAPRSTRSPAACWTRLTAASKRYRTAPCASPACAGSRSATRPSSKARSSRATAR